MTSTTSPISTAVDLSVPSAEHPACQKCSLFTNCERPFGRDVVINDGVDLALVSGSPITSHRTLLYTIERAEDAGFDPKRVRILSAVRCSPPPEKEATTTQVRCCRPFLMAELERCRAPKILGLGKTAAVALQDDGTATIKRDRSRSVAVAGLSYTPEYVAITYHPETVIRGAIGYAHHIQKDLAKAKDGSGEQPGTYETVDITEAMKRAKRLRNRTEFSFDLEWSQDGRILTCAVSTELGKAWGFALSHPEATITEAEGLAVLSTLLGGSSVKVGHNVKEDLKQAIKCGVEACGPVWDTLVMVKMLDENYPDMTLEHLVATFCAMPDYAATMRQWKRRKNTCFSTVPLDVLLAYNCGDADGGWRLYQKYQAKVRKAKWFPLFEMYMEAELVLMGNELRGFKVNADRLKARADQFVEQVKASKAEFLAVVEQYWPKTGTPFRFKKGDISPNDDDLRALLFTRMKLRGKKLRNSTKYAVNKKALTKLIPKDKAGVIKAALMLRKADKLLGTYVLGLQKRIVDGYFLMGYNIAGARTKRLSSRPNVQNIPKIMRDAFVSRWD